MIGRLSGTLVEKNPPQVTLDVGGIGYELDVPMSTFYVLPPCGEPVTLRTHLAVREDGHYLYGFLTEAERAGFRQLLKISGIGARTALSVLSGLSVAELSQAVAAGDAARLVKIPGIGKKTAERLLLELRDKLPKIGGATPAQAPAAHDDGADIENALLALGYSEREVAATIKTLPEGVGVAEGIRRALKQLSRV